MLRCLLFGGLVLGLAVALRGKSSTDAIGDIDQAIRLHLGFGELVDEPCIVEQLGSGHHERVVEAFVELADDAVDVSKLAGEGQLAAKMLGIERAWQHAGVFDADLDGVFHEGAAFISHLHVALGLLGGEPDEEVQVSFDGVEALGDRGELRLCQRLGFVYFCRHVSF